MRACVFYLFMECARGIATFQRSLFLPNKQLNALNDLSKPLILGNPNREFMIRHTTPNEGVYVYKGDGWYNQETGKTIEEDKLQ